MAERDIQLPVIVVSGDVEPPSIRRALQCGAFDFLAKPFKAEALVAAVEKALQASEMELGSAAVQPAA